MTLFSCQKDVFCNQFNWRPNEANLGGPHLHSYFKKVKIDYSLKSDQPTQFFKGVPVTETTDIAILG